MLKGKGYAVAIMIIARINHTNANAHKMIPTARPMRYKVSPA